MDDTVKMDKGEVGMRLDELPTNATSDCLISTTEVSSVPENPEQSEQSGKWWLKFKTLDSEETQNALRIEWIRRGLHRREGSVKDKVRKFESLSSSTLISQGASSLTGLADVVSDIALLLEAGMVEKVSDAKAIDAIERSLNVRRVKILEQEGKFDEAEALRGEMNPETEEIVNLKR